MSAVVKAAKRANVPIVPRGSGTGLAGGAVPAEGGIVLSLARLDRILKIDLQNRIAIVEPGVINVDVTKAVAKDGFFYAPDPSSQAACSIGGNVANNSGGPHTLAYGVTTNHVLGVEVVLDDGEILWLGGEVPDTPGYDLCGVFVGSEGTMGIVTKVAVRLMRVARVGAHAAGRSSIKWTHATQTVVDITAAGIIPAALEIMDRTTIEAVEKGAPVGLPRMPKRCSSSKSKVCANHRALNYARPGICQRNHARETRVAKDEDERQSLWKARKGAFGAMGALAPNYYVQDGVVPRSKLPEMMRRIAEISKQFNLRIANVFHAGDGNLHPNILFDMRAPGELDRVIEAGAATLTRLHRARRQHHRRAWRGLGEKSLYRSLVQRSGSGSDERACAKSFDPDGRFNPAKLFPTPASCGEVRLQPANHSGGVVDLNNEFRVPGFSCLELETRN